MATSDASQADEKQPPSWEELQTHGLVQYSPDTMRLFWTLDSPLETAIWITGTAFNTDSLEPYCRQTASGGTNWHPVSQLPLTLTKISSITVSVDQLDDWESAWLDQHRDHSEPDQSFENGCGIRYGALPDYNPAKDEEGPTYLLECCGMERPRGKGIRVLVKPTTPGRNFITIHDYLSTVHPWLMGMREDILGAMGMSVGGVPLDSETELMVSYFNMKKLIMDTKKEWFNEMRAAAYMRATRGVPASSNSS